MYRGALESGYSSTDLKSEFINEHYDGYQLKKHSSIFGYSIGTNFICNLNRNSKCNLYSWKP